VTLDHETTDSYTVTVTATDDGSNVATSQTLTVSVGDVNEAPTVTSGATGTDVSDGAAAGTTVYTATGSDVDSGTTLSYSLGGTDKASFAINSTTGVVTLASAADYDTKSSYSFTVTATDDGTGTLSSEAQAVTLSVLPRILGVTSEISTESAASISVNDEDFTDGSTEDYIHITLTLDQSGIASNLGVTSVEGLNFTLAPTDVSQLESIPSTVANGDPRMATVLGSKMTAAVNTDYTSGQFGNAAVVGDTGNPSITDSDSSTGTIRETKEVIEYWFNPVDTETSIEFTLTVDSFDTTNTGGDPTEADLTFTVDIV
jgi:hypothetical protein